VIKNRVSSLPYLLAWVPLTYVICALPKGAKGVGVTNVVALGPHPLHGFAKKAEE
jgi:hypothetical protein